MPDKLDMRLLPAYIYFLPFPTFISLPLLVSSLYLYRIHLTASFLVESLLQKHFLFCRAPHEIPGSTTAYFFAPCLTTLVSFYSPWFAQLFIHSKLI